ncbi:MAG TPA: adenylate kinase [Micromonosporaceae bacterium]|jgi:adenylate kinase family enzyme
MSVDATRIMVYGVTGSGKSTIAAKIGQRLGLPYHSVDDLTWEPGWVPVPTEIQRERIAAICAEDAWVLDTAYSAWIDVPLARVQLIVGLDLPRWRSLSQLVRRTLTRAVTRELACNGNVERWRQIIHTDSILVWHFRSFKRKQRRMRQWAADESMPPVVLLRSRQEVANWLAELPSADRSTT